MGLKDKAVKGVFWTSLGNVANFSVNFVVGIILARLLSPSDYGLIAMITVFFSIAQCFISSGFGNALVRKQDVTNDDFSTAFIFNVSASIIFFVILFLVAPLIADFYNKPILASLVRAESICMVIGSINIVQNTRFTRRIDFKTTMKIGLTTNIVGSVVGISSAYSGLGVWAIVVMDITRQLVSSTLLWKASPWRPKMIWSKKSFQYLWGYGSKLLASNLLNTIYNNIYPIVIGKFFSAASLGNYTRAQGFVTFPSSNITSVVQRVTFPVLSQIQEDDERLIAGYRRMLKMITFVVFPMTIGMAAVAKPMVLVLLTDKWAECIPYLQLLCFSAMWHPVHAINLNLLQVKGRSDLFLKLEIIKKVIATVVMVVAIPFGVLAMCAGTVLTSYASLFLNTYYTGKLVDYSIFKQLKDLFPSIVLSLLMGGLSFFFSIYLENMLIALIVGVLSGTVFYLAMAKMTRMEMLKEFVDIIKRK